MFEGYLARSPYFVVTHAILVLWALISYFGARSALSSHVEALEKKVTPNEGDFLPSGMKGEWGKLLRRYLDENRPDFQSCRASYELLIGSAPSVLATIANLLLLSGVAGTLAGLYSGAAVREEEFGGVLSAAFGAFNVTIVAICCAGLVILLRSRLERAGERTTVAIELLWDSVENTGRSTQVEAVADLMRELQPLISFIKQQGQESQTYATSLERIAAQCGRLETSLGQIAGSFGTINGDLGNYREKLDRSLEKWTEGYARAASGQDDVVHNLLASTKRVFSEMDVDRANAFQRMSLEIVQLQKQLEALNSGFLGAADKYEEKLTEVTSKHLTTMVHRLANVNQWEPELKRALEQMTPTAEEAVDRVKSLGGEVGRMLVEVKTGLDRIAQSSARQAAEAQRPPPRQKNIFGGIAAGASAGISGAILLWFLTNIVR